MDKLLDSQFILWVANFFKDLDFNPDAPPKYITQVFSLMNKIFLYILDQPKQIKITDLMKKIIEPEELPSLFIKSLIEKICENPFFKKENAHFIKNLYPVKLES